MRGLQLAQTLLALSALAGGGAMIVDPSGGALQMPLSLLDDTPFLDYRIPGLVLFTLFGLGSTLAAVALLLRPGWPWAERVNPIRSQHWSWTWSLLIGLGLPIWIVAQVAWIGYASLLQPLYFALGLVMIALLSTRSVRSELRAQEKGRGA